MIITVDASVVVKWLLDDPAREPDTDRAVLLFEAVGRGQLQALQPSHWLAEVAAVLVRSNPATALGELARLQGLELPIRDDLVVLTRACELSMQLGHHLFDTLYHAVALVTPGATLITADEAYYCKARHVGHIERLADWQPWRVQEPPLWLRGPAPARRARPSGRATTPAARTPRRPAIRQARR